jgi:hypothetical protein
MPRLVAWARKLERLPGEDETSAMLEAPSSYPMLARAYTHRVSSVVSLLDQRHARGSQFVSHARQGLHTRLAQRLTNDEYFFYLTAYLTKQKTKKN